MFILRPSVLDTFEVFFWCISSLITDTYALERGVIIIIMIIIRLLMYFFPNYSPSPGRESDLQLESLEARKQRATSFARFIFLLLLEYLCTNKNSIVLGPKPSFRIPESLKGNHLMIVTISDVTYKSISIIIRRPGGLSRSKFSFRVGSSLARSWRQLATRLSNFKQAGTISMNMQSNPIQYQ